MSGPNFQTSQKLSQNATITPRLQRALKLLQVPSAELRAELAVELAANPVLEEIDPFESREEQADSDHDAESDTESPDDFSTNDTGSAEMVISADDFSALRRIEDDWRDAYSEERRETRTIEDDERRDYFFETQTSETSFQESLVSQAREAADTPGVLAALMLLIGHLDEAGRLAEDPRDIALASGADPDAMDAAHALLRAFDPPGICARDLRDCLLLQLRAAGRADSLAARILADAYEDMLRRRFPEMARRLRVDPEDIREAMIEIGRLDPAPARRFSADDNHTVAPDILVRRDPETGELSAELAADTVPRLRLSHSYKRLLAGGALSSKDRAYLSEKIKDGRFLIDAIAHRQKTVLGVAQRLLKLQPEFFERGRAALRPLTMSVVAAELGVHETTVSRAVSGKWMRTPVGLVEMRDFFSSGYATADGGALASAGVKEMLLAVVAAEPEDRPLSDEDIAEKLGESGVKIARRTVAKYREELNIAPRFLRRRRVLS